MNEPRRPVELIALILLFLSITVITVIGFAKNWLPVAASEHAAGVDGVIQYLTLTTGAILVIGTIVFVVFLWKYGRGRPTGSPQASPRAERWWTLVPVLGMALIAEAGVLLKGLPVWEQVYGEVPEDALVVEVTGQQFEWIIRYPGPDATFGRTDPSLIHQTTNPAGLDPDDPAALDDLVFRDRLNLPTGRTAYIRLRSRDVLHSFSIPAMRVKQDVVPGIVGSTKFVPTLVGRFEIACAELCGLGHYEMGASVIVHSPEEFEQWLAEQVGWLQ